MVNVTMNNTWKAMYGIATMTMITRKLPTLILPVMAILMRMSLPARLKPVKGGEVYYAWDEATLVTPSHVRLTFDYSRIQVNTLFQIMWFLSDFYLYVKYQTIPTSLPHILWKSFSKSIPAITVSTSRRHTRWIIFALGDRFLITNTCTMHRRQQNY